MASDGVNGGAPRAGAAPLPHIDDITATPKDIDPNMSLKRLLDMCESSLRAAEMSREFHRPATALKDYLRASIIAVQVVQHHKDYPTMQSNRGSELPKRHGALLKQIKGLYETYDQVKEDIRKDNQRTGVKPQMSRPGTPHAVGSDLTAGRPQNHGLQPNGAPYPAVNGSPVRPKPAPRPKPQSLHGNAVQNNHARSSSTASAASDMLAARFAGLRGPQSSPGQDPRIRTHSFTQTARPAGPRDMPTSQKPKIGIDSSLPSLPKMPDAIYSPVRGNMSEGSARLPTSTQRGPFTRTGSSTSITGSPTASSQPPSKDYFTPVYTSSVSTEPSAFSRPSTDISSTVSSPKRSLDLSSRDVVEATELYHAMKERRSILLIDIRPREDFDTGHIMSTSIICIEPNILARDNLSADDIAESMVISPNQEQQLFERRNEYDLVVIYDEDSKEIPKLPQGQDEMALVSLHRALVHLNYGSELKQPPCLLKGGLDAWIDLMGENSLQPTAASSHIRRGAVGRRKSKYRIAPMKADEVKAWQNAVENDDMETASSPTLYRTTEDFIRRYPALPVEPENMTSPTPPSRPEKTVGYQPSNKHHAPGDLPAPLARPAPAVSRPSHSGLSIGADDHGEYGDKSGVPPQPAGRPPKAPEHPSSDISSYYTGLNNPHNWCYANSILQSLLACEFGKELTNSDWKKKYIVPRRSNEKIEQPQLMMQILSNLFHWMSTGKFEVMKASTLMNYTRHVSVQTRSDEKFGDQNQHDAQEFMTFLLTHLDDETNCRRNLQGHAAQPNTSTQSTLEAAIEFWGNHSRYHQSMVDRYWRLIELGITQCHSCNKSSYNFRTVDMITPSIGDSALKLEEALTGHVGSNVLDDFFCNTCQGPRKATTRLCYPRMPSLLCISFNRFGYNAGGMTKSTTSITWDLNHLDMAPYFLRPESCSLSRDTDDKAFKGRFGYECFAVVEHMGRTLNSGHYTAYVRDPRTHDPSAWLYCNDSAVTKVRMDNPNERSRLFKNSDCVPYLAFFRRKFGS